MKTVIVSVFAIGVSLSVAPFFNSAFAQSGNDSSAILLELQTLRSEIAELRDMVERQQFELRKVRRDLAKRPSTTNGQFAGSATTPNGQQPNSASQQPGLNNPYLQSGPAVVNSSSANVAGQSNGSSNIGAGTNIDTGAFDSSTVAGQSPEVSARDYADRASQGGASQYESTQSNAQQQNWSVQAPQQQTSVNPSVASDDTQAPRSGWVQGGANSNSGAVAGRPVLSIPTPSSAPVQTTGNVGINAGQSPTNPQSQSSVLGEPSHSGAEPAAPKSVGVTQFSEDQFYDRGFDFLKQSKYDEAVAVFEQQIATYPQGSLADDAHYWIAEAMFIDRKPADAKPHLRAIIDNYPQSPRLPDAMLKTAYIEQEMGNLIEARILLQEVVAKYPSSNAAIAAKNRLQNLNSGN